MIEPDRDHFLYAARRLAAKDRNGLADPEEPYGGKKKGADTGIDGKVFFKPDGKRTEVAIVSVKSGGVGVTMMRPDMPLTDVGAAFRAAPREKQEGDQQELTV